MLCPFVVVQPKLSVAEVSCSSAIASVTATPLGATPRRARGARDIHATYEEAWAVKMQRRLHGMDPGLGAPSPASPVLLQRTVVSPFRRVHPQRASDRPWVHPPHAHLQQAVSATPTGAQRRASACSPPPRALSPVITSTEELNVIDRPNGDQQKLARKSFRNSSTDTILNKEIIPSGRPRRSQSKVSCYPVRRI